MFAHIFKFNPNHDELGKFATYSSVGGKGWTADHAYRMKALKVPPGVSNVRINDDPNAPLQAKWTDSKNREVRLYSAMHSEKAAAEKWQRVKDFHKSGAAKKVMDAAKKDMQNRALDPKDRDVAAVVLLVAKTGFRIGSERDTGAEVQAFGASTLEKKHIKVKNNTIDFTFTGKKGVVITKRLVSEDMAGYLSHKMATLKPSDKVFSATDASARDYVKTHGGAGYKVKDFRTWQATAHALKEVNSLPVPKTQTEANKLRRKIAVAVAEQLGNTPTVALKAYIPPFVFDSWGSFSSPTPKATRKEDAEQNELEAFMDEAVETIFYDKVSDWRKMPELDYEPGMGVIKGFAKVLLN